MQSTSVSSSQSASSFLLKSVILSIMMFLKAANSFLFVKLTLNQLSPELYGAFEFCAILLFFYVCENRHFFAFDLSPIGFFCYLCADFVCFVRQNNFFSAKKIVFLFDFGMLCD